MLRNITTILLILGSMGIFFLWTEPLLQEVGQLRDEKKAVDEALSTSRELVALRDNIVSNFNLISTDDLNKFSKIIPSIPDAENLMIQFSDMAQISGMSINSLNFREEEQDPSRGVVPYGVLNIEAVFEGSYEGLVSFLKGVESSLRLIDVDNVVFSTTEENIFEFSVKAKAYFKR